ncbi:helicase [Xylanibacillus composti]|uniref:DNA helicase n=1 Tax=Xylanibacillus composti TaxID=1572762 RepID=A0A8J4H1Z5_9BACL|nr:RNA polymerase recycling motor HelD [Xylanibacillus composti]MDT9726250.1 helicase [Xylanibacillus composti]GIQ68101.1 DNA helicase [Xylanibacillus composti]
MNEQTELQQEQKRAQRVHARIEALVSELEAEAGDLKEQVVRIRKHFWEDVTVNIDNPDDVIETAISMKQQAEVLSERERSHRHTAAQLKKLDRLRDSLYFGRIDFREKGADEAESIYLGTASLIDENGEDFLIYDWRAPISSLYYDHVPGPARYETPDGFQEGEMTLKRQFIIRNGELETFFDTGETIGDELLQEVLGKGADANMKTIVATIQKEQNQIIRNDRARLLVVQGAAGSGKTSAALQRIAYLLYKHRARLKADQVVLFSPNPLFNSYVSTVLPELGEENMQQATFQEYLEHRLGRQFKVEDPFEQMEYVLTLRGAKGYEARVEAIRFKASAAFLHAIASYKDTLQQRGLIFRDIRFRGRLLISGQEIHDRFYATNPEHKFHNRLAAIAEWLLDRLAVIEEEERGKNWAKDEAEYLDPDIYDQAFRYRRKLERQNRRSAQKQTVENKAQDPSAKKDSYEQELEVLAGWVVKEKFKPLRRGIKLYRFLNIRAMYSRLLEEPELLKSCLPADASLPGHWEEACRDTLEKLKNKELSYEDATPYLYLKELLEGFHTNTTVRHVFVDEGQDYSPFQYEFLKRLFPRARMTVLGDFHQAIFTSALALSGFQALQGLYPNEDMETLRLTRSYRSTRPIVEFTRGLVGGRDIEPFNRPGTTPRLALVRSRDEAAERTAAQLREWQAAGYTSLAVICKTAEASRTAVEELRSRGLGHVHLIRKETIAFEPGIQVIPAYLAKGVEFDAVVVYDASAAEYGDESERNLFYVACTRAMHDLFLVAVHTPTPFLEDAEPGTYTLADEPTSVNR